MEDNMELYQWPNLGSWASEGKWYTKVKVDLDETQHEFHQCTNLEMMEVEDLDERQHGTPSMDKHWDDGNCGLEGMGLMKNKVVKI
ncbi:hypothetical protein CEXT_33311 [Caerostris extrusa]|uniref:Uncharacterized protein n=1 Tax=Caerostris extrusa TaxID=172846 RepID=A0AAV4T366_CAEEX|nr:hypothetical protein CEXT_33311 [Caerostris extrusa]